MSCYDGAGPRSLARFGTPLRVNVLSWIISSVIFVLATEITEGDAYTFFTVALNLAISTTLNERWVYLFTELVPLVAFTAIAVVFWMVGRREQAASQRELATLDTGELPENEPKK